MSDFLTILKQNDDDFYMKFLNQYGDLIYSRFTINDEYFSGEKGLYLYTVDDEIKYIGRCLDTFKTRVNRGYGKIVPKNCYLDG